MAIPDPCRALPDIAAIFSNAYLTSLCVVIVNEHCCPSVLPPCLFLSPHSAVLLFLPSCHCISTASSAAPHPSSSSCFSSLRSLLPIQLPAVTVSFSTKLPLPLSIVIFVGSLCRCLPAGVCYCLRLCLCVSVAGLSMWKNRFQLAVPVPERTNLPANFS